VLDLGRCLFCRECVEACPHGAIEFTRDYRMATRRRSDLEMRSDEIALAESLSAELCGLLGRSLHLRAVSAGSCGGCETELQALTNVIFDVGRFGIQFVASPRHADGLIVVGGVSRNMRHALLETYHALPQPAIVVAAGACAISGGPYAESEEVLGGVTDILPVDLFVPGCPPHPLTLLDGLLRLLGRLQG
jgi:Ni,Fe-hydrogenase III small subunit